jgi:hypothetical protein
MPMSDPAPSWQLFAQELMQIASDQHRNLSHPPAYEAGSSNAPQQDSRWAGDMLSHFGYAAQSTASECGNYTTMNWSLLSHALYAAQSVEQPFQPPLPEPLPPQLLPHSETVQPAHGVAPLHGGEVEGQSGGRTGIIEVGY